MPSYSGVWTLVAQMQAVAAGNWPKPPVEGELYSWGRNQSGQLGLNDTASRSSPVQVGALNSWSQVASGAAFTIANKSDGTMWSWGLNGANYGQLGLNDTVSRSSPVQIGALTTWYKIAAGDRHVLAIKTDGSLWSWGAYGSGRLGLNDAAISRSSPVQVGGLTNWYEVAAGEAHSIAVKTDGTLWAWGFNSNGQLGLGDTANRSSPVQVGALNNWYEVAAGASFSVAIKTDGSLWSWGFNNAGQLGQNNTVARSSPVQIGALTTWYQVATSNSSTLAIKTDGSLWAWGYNGYGQLGQNDTNYRSSPVQVGALTTWANVSAAKLQILAIKDDGTLWAWGRSNHGQLGQNDTVNRSSPVQVGALSTWVVLSKGSTSYSSLAIKKP